MDPTHQVIRQVGGPVRCLLGDVPCLSPQRAACTKQIHSRSRRWDQEPARPNPSVPIARPCAASVTSANRSARSTNRSENLSMSAISNPFSPFELVKPLARRVPRRKTVQTRPATRLMDKRHAPRLLEYVREAAARIGAELLRGRDSATIDALSTALGEQAELLDVHVDADHNVRSSRSSAKTTSSSRRSSQESAAPAIGSIFVVMKVRIQDRSGRRRAAGADPSRRHAEGSRHGHGLAGRSATSSVCRSSSTASLLPGEGRRSSAAAARRSYRDESRRVSLRRTSGPRGCTNRPEACSSAPVAR